MSEGAPLKRYIVRVELDLEVTGRPNKSDAMGHAEWVVKDCMGAREMAWTDCRLLGRPNPKRATVAPDAEV